jgi:hypothetical protein
MTWTGTFPYHDVQYGPGELKREEKKREGSGKGEGIYTLAVTDARKERGGLHNGLRNAHAYIYVCTYDYIPPR